MSPIEAQFQNVPEYYHGMYEKYSPEQTMYAFRRQMYEDVGLSYDFARPSINDEPLHNVKVITEVRVKR